MYKDRNRIPQYPPPWAAVVICFLLLAACGPSVRSYKEQRTPKATHKIISNDWTGYLRGGDHSGINKNETNINPNTAPQLKLHWEHCLNGGPVYGAVTLAPGLALVSQGHYFLVVSTADGGTLFRYFNETEQFFGPASISNGVIYVGSYAEGAGRLFAFGL